MAARSAVGLRSSTSHPWNGFDNRVAAAPGNVTLPKSVEATTSSGGTQASVESAPAEGTSSTLAGTTSDRTSIEELLSQASSAFTIDADTSFILIGDEANALFELEQVSRDSENVRLVLKSDVSVPNDRMIDFIIEYQKDGATANLAI